MPPYRRNVNTVFQSYALFEHLSIADNIAFGLKRKRLPKAEITRRVGEMLELVRLGERAKARPRQLSGGQRQRVALARALVNLPALLLLDEPLGALDLQLRKQMQIELKQIQREVGITFVYVTHDQEEALTMSDRIAVMNDGVLQQVGSAEDVYERPVNAFVAQFIGISNLIPATAESGGVRLVDGQLLPLALPDGVAAGGGRQGLRAAREALARRWRRPGGHRVDRRRDDLSRHGDELRARSSGRRAPDRDRAEHGRGDRQRAPRRRRARHGLAPPRARESAGALARGAGERVAHEPVEVHDRALAARQQAAVGDHVRAQAGLLDEHDLLVLEQRLVVHLHPVLHELLVASGWLNTSAMNVHVSGPVGTTMPVNAT